METLTKLRMRNEMLYIAPQNLIEFWAVATHPLDKNGLGLTISEATTEIETICQLFRLLPYTAEVVEMWQRIVVRHSVSGRQAHDAHLFAIMKAHRVVNILTFNGADFERFPGITVVDPAQI